MWSPTASGRLRVLEFHDQPQRLARALRLHHRDQTVETGAAPATVREPLDGLFRRRAGGAEGHALDDRRHGLPAGQVWNALVEIPLGEATTYARLAERTRPASAAVRAVGAWPTAPIPIAIVVPCHRVIGDQRRR
jgi:methylated-DNA-[protein]-cysteine S-methyltransferase